MNDRELLTLAAKAAGIEIVEWQDRINPISVLRAYKGDRRILYPWSPLTADEDALRLLARLRLSLDYRPGFVGVHKGFGPYIGQCPHNEDDPHDTAPTRRAIVRAAAEIARSGDGSPASKVTRPDEQDAPGSSIGLGAEGEQ